MSNKARLVVALMGMTLVLICEAVAIYERVSMTPAFLVGFAALSALGFWAMSFHRLGR
jgi:hypothetical protein